MAKPRHLPICSLSKVSLSSQPPSQLGTSLTAPSHVSAPPSCKCAFLLSPCILALRPHHLHPPNQFSQSSPVSSSAYGESRTAASLATYPALAVDPTLATLLNKVEALHNQCHLFGGCLEDSIFLVRATVRVCVFVRACSCLLQ